MKTFKCYWCKTDILKPTHNQRAVHSRHQRMYCYKICSSAYMKARGLAKHKVRCRCGKSLVYGELTRGQRQRVRDGQNVVCSEKCKLAARKAQRARKNMYGVPRTEYRKTWLKHHRERRLLHQVKSRAKKTGLKFNLMVEDIVIPSVCPVLQIEFKKGDKLLSPSVDRKNNRKGYVKGNIQIMSGLANVMKNKATPIQLRRFAAWINQVYGPIKKKRCKQL
jgi:hypothetical protein